MKVRDYRPSAASAQRDLGRIQESRRESPPREHRGLRGGSRGPGNSGEQAVCPSLRGKVNLDTAAIQAGWPGDSLEEKHLQPLGTWCVLQATLIFKNFKKQAIVKHLKGLMLDKYPEKND